MQSKLELYLLNLLILNKLNNLNFLIQENLKFQ